MSSILTNNGAMVALQTLKSINKGLSETQSMISTGKSISNAKDNAALWSISKVMESDVKGFKAISDSLSLGESTVAVAQNGAETITDLLTQIKGKIVASQEQNVDREKIQTDIAALRDQIGAVAGAAQFNGLNLLSNTSKDAGSGTVDVLSSLDRTGSTGVTSSNISLRKQDLTTTASAVGTMGTATGGSGVAVTDGTTGAVMTFTATVGATGMEAGNSFEVGAASGLGLSEAVSYVARDGDTLSDVTSQMVDRLNAQAKKDGLQMTFSASATTAGQIDMKNDTGADVTVAAADVTQSAAGEVDGTIGGGLESLRDIDVSTADGAADALADIEGLITTAIDSAASFGSARGRIETQSDFVSKLTDSLKSGIGSIVDANMEETSARLQALQVQQQLGVQSLSIANQAPQSILSLFR